MPMARALFSQPGPRAATMASASRIAGMAKSMSVTRMMSTEAHLPR